MTSLGDCLPGLRACKGDTVKDQSDFARFNMASTDLEMAKIGLLRALKSGNKAEIIAAKLELMGAVDEVQAKWPAGIDDDLA